MTRLMVALSGGRDSVYLLNRLLKDRMDLSAFGIEEYELCAIHVNHRIRAAADEDEAFVAKLCKKSHIPLTVVHVDAPAYAKANKLSLEDAARRLRYQAFEEADADVIALAHHAGDQAETVLMHMIRGAGLKGLCGMEDDLTSPGGKRYIRPILRISRDEINEYVAEHNLFFREDETNADTAYARNSVRHELLPNIKENYNPKVEEALCRMAANLSEDEEALLSLARREFDSMGQKLDTKALAKLPAAIQKRIFVLALAPVTRDGSMKDFAKEHFDALCGLVQKQNGTRLELPGNLTVIKDRDIICFHNCMDSTTSVDAAGFLFTKEALPGIYELKLVSPGDCWLNLSAGEYLQRAVLRTVAEGDFFYIEDRDKKPVRKLLSDFFTDRKVSKELRARALCLAVDKEILWLVGYRASARFYVNVNADKQAFHITIQ